MATQCTASQSSLPVGSFHAVAQHIHNAVIDEFGDPSFDESLDQISIGN